MTTSLILPSSEDFPKLPKNLICFASLGHFFSFKDHVQGGKVKAFGPSKLFRFVYHDQEFCALGGLIGSGLTMLGLENAICAGVEDFTFFGTAGWIGESDWETGMLVSPKKAYDETGVSEKLSFAPSGEFNRINQATSCKGLVSVPHFYAMTEKKLSHYRNLGADLVDMEVALASLFLNSKGYSLKALLQVSDGFKGADWQDKRKELAQKSDLAPAFELLLQS